ncbi:MAG TPA: acetoacetate--CoA ligase, partial [Dongiaceae bacterium]
MTDQEPLWKPGADRIAASNLARFCREVGQPVDMAALHAWSIAEPEAFWRAIWSFAGVIGDGPGKIGIENPGKMPGA